MIFLLPFFLLSIDSLNLSLDDALKVAMEKSPSRIEAILDARTGTSKLVRGITTLLPTVSVWGSYTNSPSPTSPIEGEETKVRTWTGSIGLNQVVFNVDIFGNLVQAKLYNDFYHQKARDETDNLIYSIKSGYFNLTKFYSLYDIAQSSLRRASESYKLMQEKYRLGQISKVDLLRSEAFMTQSQIDLLTAEKNLKIANEDFIGQLGIDRNVLIKPSDELTEPAVLEYQDFESLWDEVTEYNPSLNVTRKTERISKVGVFQAIGKILPEVSYYISNDYSDTSLPKSLNDWRDNDATTYGFRFDFPIFELKSLIHNIYDAKLDARKASVQFKKTEIALRKSTMSAFLSFQEANERYNYAQKNLQLNQELYELAKEQSRLGALSILDLFDVELKLDQAQTTYISSIADTYTSQALLDYLLGR
jgi:outer membrane protein